MKLFKKNRKSKSREPKITQIVDKDTLDTTTNENDEKSYEIQLTPVDIPTSASKKKKKFKHIFKAPKSFTLFDLILDPKKWNNKQDPSQISRANSLDHETNPNKNRKRRVSNIKRHVIKDRLTRYSITKLNDIPNISIYKTIDIFNILDITASSHQSSRQDLLEEMTEILKNCGTLDKIEYISSTSKLWKSSPIPVFLQQSDNWITDPLRATFSSSDEALNAWHSLYGMSFHGQPICLQLSNTDRTSVIDPKDYGLEPALMMTSPSKGSPPHTPTLTLSADDSFTTSHTHTLHKTSSNRSLKLTHSQDHEFAETIVYVENMIHEEEVMDSQETYELLCDIQLLCQPYPGLKSIWIDKRECLNAYQRNFKLPLGDRTISTYQYQQTEETFNEKSCTLLPWTFIEFYDIEYAIQCIERLHGSYHHNQQLSVCLYDYTAYLSHDYRDIFRINIHVTNTNGTNTPHSPGSTVSGGCTTPIKTPNRRRKSFTGEVKRRKNLSTDALDPSTGGLLLSSTDDFSVVEMKEESLQQTFGVLLYDFVDTNTIMDIQKRDEIFKNIYQVLIQNDHAQTRHPPSKLNRVPSQRTVHTERSGNMSYYTAQTNLHNNHGNHSTTQTQQHHQSSSIEEEHTSKETVLEALLIDEQQIRVDVLEPLTFRSTVTDTHVRFSTHSIDSTTGDGGIHVHVDHQEAHVPFENTHSEDSNIHHINSSYDNHTYYSDHEITFWSKVNCISHYNSDIVTSSKSRVSTSDTNHTHTHTHHLNVLITFSSLSDCATALNRLNDWIHTENDVIADIVIVPTNVTYWRPSVPIGKELNYRIIHKGESCGAVVLIENFPPLSTELLSKSTELQSKSTDVFTKIVEPITSRHSLDSYLTARKPSLHMTEEPSIDIVEVLASTYTQQDLIQYKEELLTFYHQSLQTSTNVYSNIRRISIFPSLNLTRTPPPHISPPAEEVGRGSMTSQYSTHTIPISSSFYNNDTHAIIACLSFQNRQDAMRAMIGLDGTCINQRSISVYVDTLTTQSSTSSPEKYDTINYGKTAGDFTFTGTSTMKSASFKTNMSLTIDTSSHLTTHDSTMGEDHTFNVAYLDDKSDKYTQGTPSNYSPQHTPVKDFHLHSDYENDDNRSNKSFNSNPRYSKRKKSAVKAQRRLSYVSPRKNPNYKSPNAAIMKKKADRIAELQVITDISKLPLQPPASPTKLVPDPHGSPTKSFIHDREHIRAMASAKSISASNSPLRGSGSLTTTPNNQIYMDSPVRMGTSALRSSGRFGSERFKRMGGDNGSVKSNLEISVDDDDDDDSYAKPYIIDVTNAISPVNISTSSTTTFPTTTNNNLHNIFGSHNKHKVSMNLDFNNTPPPSHDSYDDKDMINSPPVSILKSSKVNKLKYTSNLNVTNIPIATPEIGKDISLLLKLLYEKQSKSKQKRIDAGISKPFEKYKYLVGFRQVMNAMQHPEKVKLIIIATDIDHIPEVYEKLNPLIIQAYTKFIPTMYGFTRRHLSKLLHCKMKQCIVGITDVSKYQEIYMKIIQFIYNFNEKIVDDGMADDDYQIALGPSHGPSPVITTRKVPYDDIMKNLRESIYDEGDRSKVRMTDSDKNMMNNMAQLNINATQSPIFKRKLNPSNTTTTTTTTVAPAAATTITTSTIAKVEDTTIGLLPPPPPPAVLGGRHTTNTIKIKDRIINFDIQEPPPSDDEGDVPDGGTEDQNSTIKTHTTEKELIYTLNDHMKDMLYIHHFSKSTSKDIFTVGSDGSSIQSHSPQKPINLNDERGEEEEEEDEDSDDNIGEIFIIGNNDVSVKISSKSNTTTKNNQSGENTIMGIPKKYNNNNNNEDNDDHFSYCTEASTYSILSEEDDDDDLDIDEVDDIILSPSSYLVTSNTRSVRFSNANEITITPPTESKKHLIRSSLRNSTTSSSIRHSTSYNSLSENGEVTSCSFRDRRNSHRQSTNSGHERWSMYRSPPGPNHGSSSYKDSPMKHVSLGSVMTPQSPLLTSSKSIFGPGTSSSHKILDGGNYSSGGDLTQEILNTVPVTGSVVVIDHGSSHTRAGFSGDDLPRSVFPSVVAPTTLSAAMNSQMNNLGYQTKPSSYNDDDTTEDVPVSYYVGQRALFQKGVRYPYQNGNINSWEDMEAIWEHCFTSCLNVDTSTTRVFLTETHMPPKRTREIIVETMFELFDVEATFLHVQSVLALFAAGLTSGCVIDSGEYSTTVYPIADGYHLTNASIKLSFGGSNIDDILRYSLLSRQYSNKIQNYLIDPSVSFDTLRHIKEQYAYVQSTTIDPRTKSNRRYTLPDGQFIQLYDEDLRSCTERFFDPRKFSHICESDEISVPDAVYKSIMAASIDLRRILLGSIVLTGGNTMFEGIATRFNSEIKSLLPAGTMSNSVRIVAPPDRNNAVWIGGAILTSLSTFEDQWITGQDYDEYGAAIVHEKCQVYL